MYSEAIDIFLVSITSALFLKDDQPDGKKLNPIEPKNKRFICILLTGNYLEICLIGTKKLEFT